MEAIIYIDILIMIEAKKPKKFNFLNQMLSLCYIFFYDLKETKYHTEA